MKIDAGVELGIFEICSNKMRGPMEGSLVPKLGTRCREAERQRKRDTTVLPFRTAPFFSSSRLLPPSPLIVHHKPSSPVEEFLFFLFFSSFSHSPTFVLPDLLDQTSRTITPRPDVSKRMAAVCRNRARQF